MGLMGTRFNRRSELFAGAYQHLVNHGSQRPVNHAGAVTSG
jgi:hypothetical protein